MKNQEINFKDNFSSYSILIGENTISKLPNKVKKLCPKTKKIALFFDKNVPNKFRVDLKRKLKNYSLFTYIFTANEKSKSLQSVNNFLDKLLEKISIGLI